MKNLLAFFIVFSALPTFAGAMKEIWSMTNESVLETLGFEEEAVTIDNYQFVHIEGADLAVQTKVLVLYPIDSSEASYVCTTTYKKSADFYNVLKTRCEKPTVVGP
jgi:spore maturation protein SpmB